MDRADLDQRCVHVIDDEEPVRHTLTLMLAAGGFYARAYSSAAEFLEQMPRAPGGCIVTDVQMPGMSGLELVRRVMAEGDRFSVVVMSGYADIPISVTAMKLGASDFLQKPVTRATLLAAVTSALENPRKRVAPAAPDRVQLARFASLTPRQNDVLKGILDGKLNKTIAHELGLSVRTVESYRTEIIAKTQVQSLSELVRSAVLAGM